MPMTMRQIERANYGVLDLQATGLLSLLYLPL